MEGPVANDDGKEENDGMLVLRNVTVKYSAVWSMYMHVPTVGSIRNDSYSIQVIIMIVTSCILRFPANI